MGLDSYGLYRYGLSVAERRGVRFGLQRALLQHAGTDRVDRRPLEEPDLYSHGLYNYVVMAHIVMPLYSYGPYSYGPCSYGPI